FGIWDLLVIWFLGFGISLYVVGAVFRRSTFWLAPGFRSFSSLGLGGSRFSSFGVARSSGSFHFCLSAPTVGRVHAQPHVRSQLASTGGIVQRGCSAGGVSAARMYLSRVSRTLLSGCQMIVP